MFKYFVLLLCLETFVFQTNAQIHTITGIVLDENMRPLPHASIVALPSFDGTISNMQGQFTLVVSAKDTAIQIAYLGYENHHISLQSIANSNFTITMSTKLQNLQEVVVTDHYAEKRKKEESLNMEVVNVDFLKKHLGGSLMKSLELLPGVSTIDIGTGQSKPVIRGLSFNRVVVVENGIKHEGQQWGAEHGLEVDQYSTGRIEVVKGPASLLYGSDAIGGVVEIHPPSLPATHSLQASVDATAKSNNNFFGTSVNILHRKEKMYFNIRSTIIDYADFVVPANWVNLYEWKVPLHHGSVRNTAGKEFHFKAIAGYMSGRIKNDLILSRTYHKSGFFANASGLKPLNIDISLHDSNFRDILDPNQNVSHLKLIDKFSYSLTKTSKIHIDLAFQNNFREEWMTYSPHESEPIIFPDSLTFPSNMEKQFDKDIYTVKAMYSSKFNVNINVKAGLSTDYQRNEINGRAFLIPAFEQTGVGAFSMIQYKLAKFSSINAGIRFDAIKLHINTYHDWYAPFTQRASSMNRKYRNITWSGGYVWNIENWSLRANIGKGFRIPLAQELASNGFNRHMFRFEFGDSSLTAENSYQIDWGLAYHNKKMAISVSPFINYFPNYIFLNPSYHTNTSGITDAILQPYYFTQAKVFRTGGELHSHANITKQLEVGVITEILHSIQLSGEKKGFNLPFAPPQKLTFNATFEPKQKGKFKDNYITLYYKLALKQTNIVPPEVVTPKSNIFGIAAGTKVCLQHQEFKISFQINNIFNTKYYNHASFYRIINLPEPGRNVIINITFTVNNN